MLSIPNLPGPRLGIQGEGTREGLTQSRGKGRGSPGNKTERRSEKKLLLYSLSGQGCRVFEGCSPLTAQRSQVLRNSPIHTFLLNEAAEMFCEKAGAENLSERGRFGPGRLDKGVMGIY